jgi:hypothetical protein
MGVHFPTAASSTILASLPASGAETVICTTPPLNLILDFAQVLLFWYLVTTVGTGTTGMSYRIRRGTTTSGTQINPVDGPQPVVASQNWFQSGCFIDTPGAVAGQQYSLTIQGAATTGAGATETVTLIAMVL